MYSLNVPVPGRVAGLADDLHPKLVGFDRVRADPTLVCKRLGDPGPDEYAAVQGRVRRALAGAGPFALRVERLDYFAEPAAGPAPVVYLAVESPGLLAIHDQLCDAFEPVEGIEGADYVPHVTLARGGSLEAARALAGREVEPVAWTADELTFWDQRHGGTAGRLRLPV